MEHRPQRVQRPKFPAELMDLLAHGRMADYRLAPIGSNYTFFATVSDGVQGQCQVVYKPQRGEAPLWDFPTGTLYQRECAAYLVSEALGWGFVPPTVIREGVHGIGSVQLFMESDPAANYFTLRDAYHEEMLELCAFDVVTNNVDRKASHCLLGLEGCIWAIDHGITFHTQPRLRTVIWDFAGDHVPEHVLRDLSHLIERFPEPGGLGEQLAALLDSSEVEACSRRVGALLRSGRFPFPGPRRSVPWPLF